MSEVGSHETQVIRTNMGRYQAVCTCGWQSSIVSKGKAIQLSTNHKREETSGN